MLIEPEMFEAHCPICRTKIPVVVIPDWDGDPNVINGVRRFLALDYEQPSCGHSFTLDSIEGRRFGIELDLIERAYRVAHPWVNDWMWEGSHR